jgi:hypothetical protein
MPYRNGVVPVGTTATLIYTVGAAPENDGVVVNESYSQHLLLQNRSHRGVGKSQQIRPSRSC